MDIWTADVSSANSLALINLNLTYNQIIHENQDDYDELDDYFDDEKYYQITPNKKAKRRKHNFIMMLVIGMKMKPKSDKNQLKNTTKSGENARLEGRKFCRTKQF